MSVYVPAIALDKSSESMEAESVMLAFVFLAIVPVVGDAEKKYVMYCVESVLCLSLF